MGFRHATTEYNTSAFPDVQGHLDHIVNEIGHDFERLREYLATLDEAIKRKVASALDKLKYDQGAFSDTPMTYADLALPVNEAA